MPTGIVEVRSGKVDIGQGVLTALAQIVAEELDVNIARVHVIAATTGTSPNEGYTAGSLSVQHSGSALRLVGAETRSIYRRVAAQRWGLPEHSLSVQDGSIVAPDGRSTSYWELADDALLDCPATGSVEPKAVSDYRVVGTSVPRLDLPEMLAARPTFVHDTALDGMLYARVVRPPSRGADLIDLETDVTTMPGVVRVVRDGNFLGVIAEREEVAVRAAERLRAQAKWDEIPTLPDEDKLAAFLTSAPAQTSVLAESGVRVGHSPAHRSLEATFHRPFLAHGAMGPSSATALVTAAGRHSAGGMDPQSGRLHAGSRTGPCLRSGRGPDHRSARQRFWLLWP